MKTKHMLFVAGTATAMVLSAPLANAVVSPTRVVINPTGAVHIQQGLPCGPDLDITRPIVGGRIDITPSTIGADTNLPLTVFSLTRMELFLAPFSVQRSCLGIDASVEFFEIGLRLAAAVVFPGTPGPGPNQFRFTIPKEKFLIYESVRDSAPFPQPERTYHKPSEDVTGLIDLNPRTGAVQIQVALASRFRFRAGCVKNRCVIDEVRDGSQSAAVLGSFVAPGTDTDQDGVPDLTDNCPRVANANQSPVATPLLTPPPPATLTSCQGNIGMATAEDVCRARPVVITNDAPAKFAPGTNVVTWFGNDGIHPIVSATQAVTVNVVDTTLPTVSCTPVSPPGQAFRVRAADQCGGPLRLRLGGFTLVNGEVIQIQETGKPGVRLLPADGSDIRHFQVGKGEGIVRATDASGNEGTAACR